MQVDMSTTLHLTGKYDIWYNITLLLGYICPTALITSFMSDYNYVLWHKYDDVIEQDA